MELANSIVVLQPGMYILRHPKTGLPAISVSRAAGNPANNGQIQALYTPGTGGGVLRSGADCIVMQVMDGAVELLVTAYLDKPGATVPALKIDKIALDAGETVVPTAKKMEIPDKGLSIIGHVERRGDVVAAGAQRLGVPDANLRLEGFQIMWPDKPADVDIEYAARVEGANTLPPVRTGNFCGTRNAAARVQELKFTLVGPKAANYELAGKVWFSGGHEASIQGGKALAGPSGMEHLTGLQLEVNPKGGKGAWAPSSRTKVFKKSGK